MQSYFWWYITYGMALELFAWALIFFVLVLSTSCLNKNHKVHLTVYIWYLILAFVAATFFPLGFFGMLIGAGIALAGLFFTLLVIVATPESEEENGVILGASNFPRASNICPHCKLTYDMRDIVFNDNGSITCPKCSNNFFHSYFERVSRISIKCTNCGHVVIVQKDDFNSGITIVCTRCLKKLTPKTITSQVIQQSEDDDSS